MPGRVLVTGANGFIGRALCAELLRRGYVVRGTVRTAPVTIQVPVCVVGEIGPNTDWSAALEGVDVVIHLAARVHVMRDTVADPLAEFRLVNTAGTGHLARCAAASGVKRLVYVSSIGVNGSGTREDEAFSETDRPHPHNAYATSKCEAEQVLDRVSSETGLQTVIVRPPLVYGSDAPGNFAQILKMVAKGIPLPLAAAHNRRSLVYVGNLADALIACATHPAATGQTYLVSDGEDVSISALIGKIAHALGCSNRSFYFPTWLIRGAATVLGRSEQVEKLFGSLRVNDAKIRRELGWTPPYTLDQGLQATADGYRNSNLSNP